MKTLVSKKNQKIITKNNDGLENGFLIPILNEYEEFIEEKQWPKQIYCMVVSKDEVKGPHLHKKRWGLFTCIKGNIKLVVKIDGMYQEYFSGDEHHYRTIQVPAGIPALIVNIGNIDAYVINMPSPAWHVDDQDDWDVEFDNYNFNLKSK